VFFILPPDSGAVIDQNLRHPCPEIFCLLQGTDMLKSIQYRILYGIRNILIIPKIAERNPSERHSALLHQGDKCLRIPALCLFH
jgi:hypothetical protein